jgi:hypothetical protein
MLTLLIPLNMLAKATNLPVNVADKLLVPVTCATRKVS